MKVYKEFDLADFETWNSAKATQMEIISRGKTEEFNNLLDELYPDGMEETELNDLLWFESEWIFEMLGIQGEEEEEEEEE